MRTTLLISEIVKEWLDNTDIRPVTKENYRRKINLWFRWLSAHHVDPRDPRTKDVIDYKDDLFRTGHSSFTANGYIVVIKLFYKYCERQRYCENIAANVKSSFKMTGRNKLPLTLEQSQQLLSSIDVSSVKGKRDRAMIALMLFNGLRTCEVERADIKDLDIREGVQILNVQRKGRVDKSEWVLLHQETMNYIEDYISCRKFSLQDPMFISERGQDRGEDLRLSKHMIARMVKQRLRSIGIDDKKISAHSLRHTFGSLLVEQGVEMEDIRQLMGHSSIDVTRIYIELVQQRKLLHHSPATDLVDKILHREKLVPCCRN